MSKTICGNAVNCPGKELTLQGNRLGLCHSTDCKEDSADATEKKASSTVFTAENMA